MFKAKLESMLLNRAAKKGKKIKELYEVHSGGINITTEIIDMVVEFHTLFQHPVDSRITPELLELRARLIREEAIEEGLEAVKNNDLEQILDSMADFLYVGMGTIVSMEHGVGNAMSVFKEDQSFGIYHRYVAAVNLTPHDDIIMALSEAGVAADKLDAVANEFRAARNPSKLTKISVDLRGAMNHVYVAAQMVYHLAHLMKIDIVELVAEVHRSNMTKLWPSDDAQRIESLKECKYDPNDLAFRRAEGRDGMIGYRISDGKILKSPTYEPADLSRFVAIAEGSVIGRHLFSHNA